MSVITAVQPHALFNESDYIYLPVPGAENRRPDRDAGTMSQRTGGIAPGRTNSPRLSTPGYPDCNAWRGGYCTARIWRTTPCRRLF